jgi:hypothetical protein
MALVALAAVETLTPMVELIWAVVAAAQDAQVVLV